MFSRPVLTVLAFVGASIATAYLYQHWQMSRLEAPIAGGENFASQQSVLDQAREIYRQGRRAARGASPVSGGDRRLLQTGSDKECLAVEGMPGVYREKRVRSAADFPRSCAVYLLNRARAEMNAGCSDPRQGCVSENYANSIYNTYADLTACLGLAQKESLPRWNVARDLALNEGDLSDLQKRIVVTKADPCRRLVALFKKTEAAPKGPKTCSETNPVRGLFLAAARDVGVWDALRSEMERSKVSALALKAGFSPDETDPIEQMLFSLALQSDAKTVVEIFQGYLKLRLHLGRQSRQLASQGPGLGFLDYLKQAGFQKQAGTLENLRSEIQHLNSVFTEGVCAPDSSSLPF